MQLIRYAVAGLLAVILAGGNIAAVSASLSGTAPDYTERLARAPLDAITLLLLIAVAALAIAPPEKEAT